MKERGGEREKEKGKKREKEGEWGWGMVEREDKEWEGVRAIYRERKLTHIQFVFQNCGAHSQQLQYDEAITNSQ